MDRKRRSRLAGVADHPRTSLLLALLLSVGASLTTSVLFRAVVTGAVVLLLANSLWQWDRFQAFRQRTPFRLQSPVVRRNPKPAQAPITDYGVLDFAVFWERSMADATRVITKMASAAGKYSAGVGKQTERIQRIQGADLETRHRTLTRSAEPIAKQAAVLEQLERQYRVHTESIDHNGRLWLSATSEDLHGFAPSVVALKANIEVSTESTRNWRSSVQGTRSMNIHQAINSATDRLLAVLDRIIEDNNMYLAYCDWAIERIGQSGSTA